MAKTLTGVARRELIDAVRARYRISTRAEKRLILKEFSAITGYHRKSAIRVLNQIDGADAAVPRAARPRVYDEAFRRTLVVLWEASDRVCGKRLRGHSADAGPGARASWAHGARSGHASEALGDQRGLDR